MRLILQGGGGGCGGGDCDIYTTFNNILGISWRSVLFAEETRIIPHSCCKYVHINKNTSCSNSLNLALL
jgi:hypothetical protein